MTDTGYETGWISYYNPVLVVSSLDEVADLRETYPKLLEDIVDFNVFVADDPTARWQGFRVTRVFVSSTVGRDAAVVWAMRNMLTFTLGVDKQPIYLVPSSGWDEPDYKLLLAKYLIHVMYCDPFNQSRALKLSSVTWTEAEWNQLVQLSAHTQENGFD